MLLSKIKSDAIAARKAKSGAASVLVTLLGEIETKTKTFSPSRDIRDDEVIAIIRKFINGADQLIGSTTDPDRISVAQAEKGVLEAYLPAQMTEDQLKEFIKPIVDGGGNIGQVMKALQVEHAGKFDGKLASDLARNLMK